MEKIIDPYFKFPFSPEEAVNQLFTGTSPDYLIGVIDEWLPVALANKVGRYPDPETRQNLVLFIDDFKELIQVMGPPNFKNKKELVLVKTEFAEKYSLAYVRQELFDLFISAITYEGLLEVQKITAGSLYLSFASLIHGTFFLKVEDKLPKFPA